MLLRLHQDVAHRDRTSPQRSPRRTPTNGCFTICENGFRCPWSTLAPTSLVRTSLPDRANLTRTFWRELETYLTRTLCMFDRLETRPNLTNARRNRHRAQPITRHHLIPRPFNNRPSDTPETPAPWIPPWPGTWGQGADPDTAGSALPYDDTDWTARTIRAGRRGDRGGYERMPEARVPDKLCVAAQTINEYDLCLFSYQNPEINRPAPTFFLTHIHLRSMHSA